MRLLLNVSLVCWLLIFCRWSTAGVPTVSHVEVSDLTPKSFSVFWITSEPSTAELYLYQGDCITPFSGVDVTAQGNDSTGILKVTVSGLSPNTTYCFQTVTKSKSTGDVTIYPNSPSPVTTEKRTNRIMTLNERMIPFANDVLRLPTVYLSPPTNTQEGVLVVLNILGEKQTRPISLLLAEKSEYYFNLNNLFDPTTSENINLSGGERIRIRELHGTSGCTIETFRRVPADIELTGARNPESCFIPEDLDCNNSVNILDILRAVQWFGTSTGAICFNSDIDLNKDDTVNILDILTVVGSFGATP